MAVLEVLIETDPWLTEQMQRDVFTLNFDRAHIIRFITQRRVAVDSGNFERLRELQAGPVFMSAKVSPNDVAACRFLEDRGFHLVDTNLSFDILDDAVPPPPENGEIEFREATPADRNAVVDIARSSFRYSRFHLDPEIPDELANQIKGAWTENYFNGKRGDLMIVAVNQGRVIGYALLMQHGHVHRRIDLIAVDREFQGRGVARGMICTAVARCPRIGQQPPPCHNVGTQLANEASISLYQKLGFRLTGGQYIFHFHNK